MSYFNYEVVQKPAGISVKHGSVRIYDENGEMRDDGNGNVVDSTGRIVFEINYETGVFSGIDDVHQHHPIRFQYQPTATPKRKKKQKPWYRRGEKW